MLRILLATLCFATFVIPSAQAQEGKPPKELVEKLSQKAFDGFIAVKNAKGEHIVPPEEAKKLKHPLTPYAEREMAVARGFLSGTAKWCGLKWDTDYFIPYLTSLKKEHGKNWTPFQYGYTEMLHGLSMAVAQKEKGAEKCPAAEKARIAALAKK